MTAKPRGSFSFVPYAILLLIGARPAVGQVEYTVTTDLPDDYQQIDPIIKANLESAARAWSDFVDAKPCRIEITLHLDRAASSGRGSGRSAVSARLGDEKHAGLLVSEQGWASMMRTGKDPNGEKPDIEVIFEPDYFKTLWWDPRPDLRKERVPNNKLDAYSVILHEFGHALAFNGWMNPKTGEILDLFVSSYDRHVTYDGKNFFFTGPQAVKLWGAPVPLARSNNNYHHVCETPTGRDALLKSDLMNGIVMQYGQRYDITLLDLAILHDCRIPLKPIKDTRPAKDNNPVRPAQHPQAPPPPPPPPPPPQPPPPPPGPPPRPTPKSR
jgi:hypothetical protein